MNIDFIGNVYAFAGGWWVFLWFILFTVLIATFSLSVVQTIENMAARTKRIKPIFYTAILLAFATSVPELMTGIDSGILNQPIFAYFNNSGSNFMNEFLVALFIIGFSAYFDKKIFKAIKEQKAVNIKLVKVHSIAYENNVVARTFNTKNKDNVAVIWVLVVLNILLVCASYIPQFGNVTIPGLEISVVSILPIGAWLIFLIYLFVKAKGQTQNPKVDETTIWYRMPKFWLFVSFFVLVFALGVVSIIEADLVQSFSHMYHIDDVLSGGLLLAFATGLPEFVSNLFLFKKQHFNMVLESVVGSIWMNTLLVFFVDVSFRHAGLFHYANEVIANPALALHSGALKNAVMMGPWNILGLVLVSFLPIAITKKVGNSKSLGLILMTLYALTFVVGFSTISGVFWNY